MSSAELKKKGLKVTLPRLKILEILEQKGDDHHLTAEDVYKILIEQDEDVGLATVYRVLTQFEQAGIVRRLNFENNISVFELDTGDNHDHLVCIKTGRVKEFVDPVIEQRIIEIAKEKGYDLSAHSLVIYGTYQNKDGLSD
ncbi:MAG: ferric iron uptake transcriptional regulator [Piscirickettsiaceae bacterium CG_4_9_14_3_um_filter_43_564]|nr:ferric iron uptake transcriptional regulator [Thiomicrospira sp.]OIP94755.1 MAG: transcriptional repressor [Thiomicrospira sp. CG2_30_44_34]PIQ03169.1 MAG: ferric iron uptake transcriptional regulator [Piscirickettsiaceae bacterium CG18_big_fil_WC_8_21_14_2_50_44_103]PIU39444.1 MAG: ferric iron uptake transcriptional regulator [Piscirickettsiaceae bacterium CG07_land_8_20_14_0_80_44_28]PIW58531.1 MAG: ferric iron uptake transcriptional regulator [Piscirickettsiaceae bacterium CG12_big_fil_re